MQETRHCVRDALLSNYIRGQPGTRGSSGVRMGAAGSLQVRTGTADSSGVNPGAAGNSEVGAVVASPGAPSG